MPIVYKFSGFPRQIGFVVGEDEPIYEAVNEALESWSKDQVTEHNLQAYLSSGQIEQVKEFPDTDKGWDEAVEFTDDLEKY